MESPIQKFSTSSLMENLSLSPLPTINGRKVQQAPVSPVSPLKANAVLAKIANLLPYPLSWIEKEAIEAKRPLTAADKKEIRQAISHVNISDQKAALTKAYQKRVARCERPPLTVTEEMPILVINPLKRNASLHYQGINVSMCTPLLNEDNIRIGLMALWTRKYLKST